MTPLKAMRDALDALKSVQDFKPNDETNNAIKALRTTIEEMERQEPVAWIDNLGGLTRRKKYAVTPLYTHPPIHEVDCKRCANHGCVDGLSQETFCEHCIYQERWRKDYYTPKPGETE